jgi:hypothetical protein
VGAGVEAVDFSAVTTVLRLVGFAGVVARLPSLMAPERNDSRHHLHGIGS